LWEIEIGHHILMLFKIMITKMIEANKIEKFSLNIFAIGLCLAISMPIAIISIYLSFIIHEFGHILFGSVYSFFKFGYFPKIEIINWVDVPLLPFKLPQQVKMFEGTPTILYVEGGILSVVLFWTAISFIVYYSISSKYRISIFIVPILFSINEVLGNFFCGTDNPLIQPTSFCQAHSGIIYLVLPWIPYLWFIPITLICYPTIIEKLEQYRNSLVCRLKK
jgi:hypothetical protein